MNQTSFSLRGVLSVAILLVVLSGLGWYVYSQTTLQSSPVSVDSPSVPRTYSSSELAQVRSRYREQFRVGCSLEEPTSFTFPDKITLTATFAKCKPRYPQKSYKVGLWAKGNAIIETDESTKKELATIIIYGKISDVASSTVVAKKLSDAQGYYALYRSKLPKLETQNDNITMHTDVVDGYVVIYQADLIRTNFDETTVSIKSVK